MTAIGDSSIYTDFNGLAELKQRANANSKEALEAVARQFESIFMQMMLKSMREAKLSEGIFESQQSDIFTDMYDKQITTSLSSGGNGIGLAEIMIKQLSEGVGAPTATPVKPDEMGPLPERLPFRFRQQVPVEQAKPAMAPELNTPEQFIHHLMPHAQRAARKLGVQPQVLIAQAALETGWGEAVITHRDGSSSHNLFNIKADHRWGGEQVAKQTLEYRDGVARKELAAFRSYDSFADSFDDYAEFLMSSPRYHEALSHAGEPVEFTRELQKAGYATDPEYASKINRIIDDSDFNEVLLELKISGQGTLSNG